MIRRRTLHACMGAHKASHAESALHRFGFFHPFERRTYVSALLQFVQTTHMACAMHAVLPLSTVPVSPLGLSVGLLTAPQLLVWLYSCGVVQCLSKGSDLIIYGWTVQVVELVSYFASPPQEGYPNFKRAVSCFRDLVR